MYLEGELSIVRPGGFEREGGEKVQYFTNWIKTKTPDGIVEVFQLNSKEDFSEAEGKTGVFSLRLYSPQNVFDREGKPQKSLYKISLIGFRQAEI